jgi:Protein of unknown function (DUF3592)
MKIISGFFIGLFCFFIVVGIDSYWKQRFAHEHFQPVEAVITRSEISCHNSARCTADIEYSYTVAGKPYKATRYAFVSYDEPLSRRMKRYPLNAKVTAYADPDDPSEAVLDNTSWSAWDIACMIGIPFGLLLAFYLLRHRLLAFVMNIASRYSR